MGHSQLALRHVDVDRVMPDDTTSDDVVISDVGLPLDHRRLEHSRFAHGHVDVDRAMMT